MIRYLQENYTLVGIFYVEKKLKTLPYCSICGNSMQWVTIKTPNDLSIFNRTTGVKNIYQRWSCSQRRLFGRHATGSLRVI